MYAINCLKPSFKLSNRKLVFFNHTKDIDCRECDCNLLDELIVSRPKGKYVCVNCGIRIGIVDEDIMDKIQAENDYSVKA